MRKKRPPTGVYLEESVEELYLSLREGSELKKAIDRGLDILKENMLAGDSVRKKQIPQYYRDRFSVNNLYRLRLDRKRRLTYTILSDEEGKKVVILEVFPDHKSYDRRFGYKTS